MHRGAPLQPGTRSETRHRLLLLAVGATGLVACGIGTRGTFAGDGGVPPVGDSGPWTPSDGSATCPSGGAALLKTLGRNHFLVGMDGDTCGDTALFDSSGVPIDIRYDYLAGGVANGAPCTSCSSCSSIPSGNNWWGCWNGGTPGQYAIDVITDSSAHGAIPMFSYYEILQSSGVAEGAPEVAAVGANANLTKSVLADFAFLMDLIQRTATGPVLVQVEPDFWGYAEQLHKDPSTLPAIVSSADPADCGTLPNTIAGFGQCFIAIARKHSPKVKIALHVSSWGWSVDLEYNTDPRYDVTADSDIDANFMKQVGAASGDFLTFDTSDVDAGYSGTFWDPTNATLPDYTQALTFSGRVARDLGLPAMWWQTPYGNPSLPNVCNQYKDNRVDYFFAHPDQFVAANGFAIAFGPGQDCMTQASTDGGNFIKKARAYYAAGAEPLCR